MANERDPNPASEKEQAEGDRDTAGQNYDAAEAPPGAEAGGITNRPLDEEIENQQAVPDRGKRKDEER